MSDADRTFVLELSYIPDMANRRAPYREAHLAYLMSAVDEGRILFAGALQDPVDTGVVVIKAESAAAVYTWITADPNTQADLIRGIRVREVSVAVPRP